MLEAVREAASPGIVYVATRATAKNLAGKLRQEGVQAVYYHGAMSRAEREEAQAAFMADRFDVAGATTAFRMGIDKPEVRFVFHYDIPDSVDSLYHRDRSRRARRGPGRDRSVLPLGGSRVETVLCRERQEGDKIVILFDSVGYKTLSLELVTEQNLLQQAS